jgi:hypothetical protein
MLVPDILTHDEPVTLRYDLSDKDSKVSFNLKIEKKTKFKPDTINYPSMEEIKKSPKFDIDFTKFAQNFYNKPFICTGDILSHTFTIPDPESKKDKMSDDLLTNLNLQAFRQLHSGYTNSVLHFIP